MIFYVSAVLIGIVSGLRTFTAPAAVAWAAQLGILPLHNTPLAFLGSVAATYIFTLLALGEFVTDQLKATPSRKVPMQFIARLISGALCGAAIGAAHNALAIGLVAGLIGAVIGTFAGYEMRMRLAKALGRDLPAGLIEDVIAIVIAALVVVTA